MIHELRTSKCRSFRSVEDLEMQKIQKRQRNHRSNFQHPLDYRKSKGIPNISFIDNAKAFDCVNLNKLWKILKEMRISDHLTCFLRNLYTGQEATVRSKHGTMDWFQIEKGVVKAVYCHLVYLTYMQTTAFKMLGWSGQPFSSPGDPHNPGIEPRSPTLQADSLPAEPQGKPKNTGAEAYSFSSKSSQPRSLTRVFCIASGLFTNQVIREAPICRVHHAKCWAE